jgi:hypothetical protein
MDMELFIKTTETPALAELTQAVEALAPRLDECQSLFARQKHCLLGKRVAIGHPREDIWLRELEVAEILLDDARDAMFPLIEPVKTAYLKVEAEIPSVAVERLSRVARKAMANAAFARDLYEEAAAIYFEADIRNRHAASYIGLEREWQRRSDAPDHRRYTVRFAGSGEFNAPFMNPAEVWALTCHVTGQYAGATWQVRDESTGKAVNDLAIRNAFNVEIGQAIAQQWMGNVVAQDWWNKLWSNEQFAQGCVELARLFRKLKPGQRLSPATLERIKTVLVEMCCCPPDTAAALEVALKRIK